MNIYNWLKLYANTQDERAARLINTANDKRSSRHTRADKLDQAHMATELANRCRQAADEIERLRGTYTPAKRLERALILIGNEWGLTPEQILEWLDDDNHHSWNKEN